MVGGEEAPGGTLSFVHWTVTADPPLLNANGCEPAITIPGPTHGQDVHMQRY